MNKYLVSSEHCTLVCYISSTGFKYAVRMLRVLERLAYGKSIEIIKFNLPSPPWCRGVGMHSQCYPPVHWGNWSREIAYMHRVPRQRAGACCSTCSAELEACWCVGFEKTALVDRGCCSKRVYTEYKGANFRWVRVELKQRIVVRCRVRGLDGRIGRE